MCVVVCKYQSSVNNFVQIEFGFGIRVEIASGDIASGDVVMWFPL